MKVLYFFLIILIFTTCTSTGVEKNEFTVDIKSNNLQIGEIQAHFDTFLGIGQLNNQDMTVTYYPREDVVCLQYRSEYITYNQFWNRRGRHIFISALEKYNEEYNARTLNIRSGRNERRAYGTTQGYLVWQQYSFSVQARAGMNVELGYAFKERYPYFAITQREAQYIDKLSRDSNRTSGNITIYFTRTQAAELAALFDPQYLAQFSIQNTLPGLNQERIIIRDDY